MLDSTEKELLKFKIDALALQLKALFHLETGRWAMEMGDERAGVHC